MDGAMTWERQVAARLRAGDDTALAALYDQFSALVHGIATRVTGDAAAAADVTQDVFVQVWERPGAFDPERGSWRAFLSVLARRRAVDHVRSRARATTRELRASRQVTVAPDVEEAASALLTSESVRRAVDDLPMAQRDALRLAYFEGLTFREVAVRLGIPEGTAKSRLRLGLGRLATVLQAEGPVSWT